MRQEWALANLCGRFVTIEIKDTFDSAIYYTDGDDGLHAAPGVLERVVTTNNAMRIVDNNKTEQATLKLARWLLSYSPMFDYDNAVMADAIEIAKQILGE